MVRRIATVIACTGAVVSAAGLAAVGTPVRPLPLLAAGAVLLVIGFGVAGVARRAGKAGGR